MTEINNSIMNWVNLYYGNAIFLILALYSYIYLFVHCKEIKVKIIYPLLFIIFVIVNPVLYRYLFSKVVYWRLLWMLPNAIVIAYAITIMLRQSQRRMSSLLVVVLFGLCVVLRGSNVYQNAGFSTIQNQQKISSTTKKICDVILNRNASPKCIMPLGINSEVRQYSGDIQLVYGRDMEGYIISNVYGLESKLYSISSFATSSIEDYQYLFRVSNIFNCDYVVLQEQMVLSDALVRECGYVLLDKIDGYSIYENCVENEWRIVQCDSGFSNAYMILGPDKHCILIDGSGHYSYIKNLIQEGGYKVDAWMLTSVHYMEAFVNWLQDENRFPVEMFYTIDISAEDYLASAASYEPTTLYVKAREGLETIPNVVYVETGDVLNHIGLEIEVLSACDEESVQYGIGYNSAMVLSIKCKEQNFLYLSSLNRNGYDLISSRMQSITDYDYIQVSNGGGCSLPVEFYMQFTPRVVFYSACADMIDEEWYSGVELFEYFRKQEVTILTNDNYPNLVLFR